jgi:hypothetical protein
MKLRDLLGSLLGFIAVSAAGLFLLIAECISWVKYKDPWDEANIVVHTLKNHFVLAS